MISLDIQETVYRLFTRGFIQANGGRETTTMCNDRKRAARQYRRLVDRMVRAVPGLTRGRALALCQKWAMDALWGGEPLPWTVDQIRARVAQ